MDRQAAINLITDTFNSSFNENRFRHFIRNLFNEFDEYKNASWITGYIKDSFKDHVKKYKRIGKYKDIDGNKLDVVVVHLRKESALDSARTMQRNFIASYLKTRGEKEAAVVAYFTDNTDDWRFSYVRMEYRQKITESGKIKVKEEFTSRRYSFLVGKNEPNHTAQQQLFPILCDDQNNPSLSELEKAFSVETVTKQFYQDYKGLFGKLTVELERIIEKDSKIKSEFKDKSIDPANFAKKLLGQIVFLYFLQKKGWLGVGKDDKGDFKSWGTGPKNFMRRIFEKKYTQYDNFFNHVLEPLFYEALATERPGDYYSRFNCKIPFLNGGLFEPIGEYNWQETDILIHNDLFSEIFETFDQYNFTVREDEPLEKEVAVDPEMLGKVFENLLPGNLRKGQGAYYTPREIVHYMCQESLINYLDTAVNTGEISLAQEKSTQGKLFGTPEPKQLGLKTTGYKTVIPRKDMENFICKGEFAIEHDTAKEEGTTSYKYQVDESIRKNAQLLDEKLKTIKICDPAIGSGAFPVGMMHEIVKGRNVLTTYLEKSQSRSIYDFKRRCIQESLYGVDIDPGAIEIAKLRLWLSLVVDEENYLDIKPLPNLDYKIMQGNSLIELLSTESLVSSIGHRRIKLVKELKKAKDELFNITIPTQKENKRREIDILMKKLFEYDRDKQIKRLKDDILAVKSQQRLFEDDKDKKEDEKKIRVIESRIEEIKNIDIPSPTEHFEWYVNYSEIFQEKGGFDVVIANPPYLKERDNKKVFEFVNNSEFGKKYHQGKMDYWYYFLHKAIDVVRKKGIISYITSRYWLNSSGAKKLIQRVKEELSFVSFVDIGKLKVFDEVAGQHMVALYAKNKALDNFLYKKLINDLTDIDSKQDTDNISIKTFTNSKIFSHQHEILIEEDLIEFKECVDLGEICDVFQGVVQNPDKVSAISATKYDLPQGEGVFVLNYHEYKTLKLNAEERDFVRPFFDECDIHKYLIRPQQEKCLIYLTPFNCKNIDTFPNLKKHLIKYKQIMDARRETKKGVNKWFHLHWPRREEQFAKKKLVLPAMFKRQNVGYMETEGYFGLSSNIIIQKNTNYSLKYILAILNSSLAFDWFHRYGKKRGVGVDIGVNKLRTFPVKKLSLKFQETFKDCVDRILSITKGDDYLQNSQKQAEVKALEKEIDQLVYKLYGLTEEEIKIVEWRVHHE